MKTSKNQCTRWRNPCLSPTSSSVEKPLTLTCINLNWHRDWITIKLLCLRKYHSGLWSARTPPEASANSNLVTVDFLTHASGFNVWLRKQMLLLVTCVTCWQTLMTNKGMKTTAASELVHQLWWPFRYISYSREWV